MEKRFYTNISSLNNIDVEVICDGNTIYTGNVNDAGADIKAMMYYNIELGNTTKVYVAKQENQTE
ncbi:MAG: hypothetical protein K6B70_05380 [Clostridia bacterium]|nr:hypothetical protein [Clostridia bacterium]